MRRLITLPLAAINLLVSLWGIHCGTISEVDNRTGISGKVEYQDGDPAENTVVTIRPSDYLPMTEQYFTRTDTTDIKGNFEFDRVPEGSYIIVGNHKDTLFVLIDSVIMPPDTDTTILLPTATLGSPGAIQGTIRFAGEGYYSQIYVLVFGLGRFATVNQDGEFLLDTLPAGKYRLRFLDIMDGTNFLDMSEIEVDTGKTDTLTVVMDSTSLPQPSNFLSSYDSLAQIVTLTWNKLNKNYNLSYRIQRSVDYANYEVLTSSSFTDTFFRDDVVYYPDLHVVYKVTSVDSTGKESAERKNIIEVKSRWEVDTVRFDIPVPDASVKCYPGKNGDWWIARKAAGGDSSQPEVSRHDSLGKFLMSWKPFQMNGMSAEHYTDPGRLAFDDNGNIYSLGSDVSGYNYRLCKFDSSFSLIDTIMVPGDDAYYPVVSFGIRNNHIYIVNNRWELRVDTITVFDTSLRLIGSYEFDDTVTETDNISVFNDSIAVGVVNDSLKIIYLDNQLNEIGGFDVTPFVDSIQSQLSQNDQKPYYRRVTPLHDGFCIIANINVHNLLFYFDRPAGRWYRCLIGNFVHMRFLANGSFITDGSGNAEIYHYSMIGK